MTVGAILALAVATFGLRFGGTILRGKVELSPSLERWVTRAATVLLLAVVTTSTLTNDEGGFAGWALPCGVAVGAIAAWRKAPFIVVVVAAAATTALLRVLGIG